MHKTTLTSIALLLTALTGGCISKSQPPEKMEPAINTSLYDGILDNADAQFQKGEFKTAAELLVNLLADDQDIPLPQRARLYLLKARLEMAFANEADVKLWLIKLRKIAPDTVLDPLHEPPQTIAIWRGLK